MRRGLGAGVTAVAAAILVVIIAAAGADTPGHRIGHARSPAVDPPRAAVVNQPVTVRIGSAGAAGVRVPAGFLGFSFEFGAVRTYTGTDPGAINPVLEQLIRNLSPGQAPVIRIGGDSTDLSWVPAPGIAPPHYVNYPLTPSWLATTAALAHALDARLTLGINLAANRPALAGAEGTAFMDSFGARTLAALEIGNEPNVYAKVRLLHTSHGTTVAARPRTFGYPGYRRQYAAEAARLPTLPAWGPALAVGPGPEAGSWIDTIPDFLRRNPRVTTMTVHRYPLRNCNVPPSSPQYPSVVHLLSDYATRGLALGLHPWIARAHAQGRRLRVDELNSVACRGKAGVSDVFASALWMTDALFSLVHAHVDGVNVHTLPDAAYQLFAFSRRAGSWRASVKPVYYGLQLFAQAAPSGSRLLTTNQPTHAPGLSVWSTRAPGGTVRTVLINKSTSINRTVTLRPPPGLAASAVVERLSGPSVHARAGITLGGRSYGTSTATGQLPAPLKAVVTRRGAGFLIRLPRASAALVTLAPR